METKKQTAVDMFCTTITDHIEAIFNGSIQQDEFAKRMRQSYNQSKEMERQQIIDAWIDGEGYDDIAATPIAEQYYNETYGN
jgi:uncharacterized protein YggL (DUF469 family)